MNMLEFVYAWLNAMNVVFNHGLLNPSKSARGLLQLVQTVYHWFVSEVIRYTNMCKIPNNRKMLKYALYGLALSILGTMLAMSQWGVSVDSVFQVFAGVAVIEFIAFMGRVKNSK